MPSTSHDGGTSLLTGGGFTSFGGGAAGAGSAGGGQVAGGAAGGGQAAGGAAGGTSATGGGTVTINATDLVAGQAVRVNSTGATGNPQRNYRIVVPSGKTELALTLSGGTCAPHTCIGGDVQLFLKRGALPDAFAPDSTTTKWTYTPGGTGTYGKPAAAGETWYLGIIDGANTLGYRDVDLTVFPSGPSCGGSGSPCSSPSECCTGQCIPTGPSTKLCG